MTRLSRTRTSISSRDIYSEYFEFIEMLFHFVYRWGELYSAYFDGCFLICVTREKEKSDVDKLANPSVQAMFSDKSSLDKQMSKEQVCCFVTCPACSLH